MQSDRSFDQDMDAEKEDAKSEEPVMRIGVTPFLSGVLPAGKLRARTKPVGCQAYGLIQVRLKVMSVICYTNNTEPQNWRHE